MEAMHVNATLLLFSSKNKQGTSSEHLVSKEHAQSSGEAQERPSLMVANVFFSSPTSKRTSLGKKEAKIPSSLPKKQHGYGSYWPCYPQARENLEH